MNRFFSFLKNNYKPISHSLLFILSIVIVVYVLPREGKFKYEFHKGEPWRHDDLIAPFDFPVYKSEEQLKREKDSILREEYKPYFVYDSTVAVDQKRKFKQVLYNFTSPDTILIEKNSQIIENILSEIDFIYEKGIIESVEVIEEVDKEDLFIVVIRNNFAEEYEYSEVFTQKSAYEFVSKRLNEILQLREENIEPKFSKFLNSYNFNQIIEPNLFYDYETSTRAKQELVKNISLTVGKVLADERIISKGELITQEEYQILTSLKREYESWLGNSANYYMILLGKILFIVISFLMIYLFLYHFRSEILNDFLKTVFILFIVVLFVVVGSLIVRFDVVNHYIIPFAILPIIIRTFYDDRLAVFIHTMTIFMVGYFIPNSFEFVFLNFIAGIVAIFSLTTLYRRRRLIITSILIFITYVVVYFALSIVHEGDVLKIDAFNFIWFFINAFLVLLVYLMIYVFEKVFGFLSDVTLMELSDTNQELLRKLAEDAPGTFQHSLQVANLAEEAIFQIGGNTLLVRTGALYHDIGKMENPVYFTENQTSNINLHDELDCEESAKIIIGHVEKGLEIAKKHKLPEPVIDFIRTHHGTTKVQYFYKSFIKKYPEKNVDIQNFKYPGPVPYSKETAVLMMADSVEAASRSLKDITEKSINELVENIIDYQVTEEQFNDANITFKDIQTVKNIFKKKLQNIYHVRISYPE